MSLKQVTILFCVLMISWSLAQTTAHANEEKSIKELEPVIYEKLKFKKNTDYLHDRKKTEMKNTIPEKQFNIYFDGRRKLPNRKDTSYLFQTSNRGERSTVSAKTSDLKLFTNESKGEKEQSSASLNMEPAGNRTRTLILLAIIAVGLVTLFMVFIPKMVNTPTSNKTIRS
ncbi:type VII secretion EssA family protein [Psychrobacillus sp. FJAT-51614]|uniref:Type VII secretion EssA family protein n=1 Tax=Psychrobacillus mangrovi TaxID=3117745 RepID=A0ABU8F0X5_9BACI